jgi:hypothetical protein
MEFLDRHLIRNANISGIGPAKTAALISFGIETAGDVNRVSVLRVPGIGSEMANKLMAWRSKIEASFHFDLRQSRIDEADEAALRSRFLTERSRISKFIIDGASTIARFSDRFSALSENAKCDNLFKRALLVWRQAEADLKILGVAVPGSKVGFPIAPQTVFKGPSAPATPAHVPTSSSPPPRFPAVPQPPGSIPSSSPSPARVPTSDPPLGSGSSAAKTQQTSTSPPRCPRCGAVMVRRTARRGYNAGNLFWGCSKYPRCKGLRN